MDFLYFSKKTLLLVILVNLSHLPMGNPSKEYHFPSDPEHSMKLHGGQVLVGHIPVTIIWYGMFAETQKTIIKNFLDSLTKVPPTQQSNPSVSQWFDTLLQLYLPQEPTTHVHLDNKDFNDENYSLGKYLNLSQICQLATSTEPEKGGIALVFTAQDVDVEGFCCSRCGLHALDSINQTPYIWVGNPEKKCPGQCAWPFHENENGPKYNLSVLKPPNGDMGAASVVMNLARMIADCITNPFEDGFFQGPKEMGLGVTGACPGVFGKDAFQGFGGYVFNDSESGESYNAKGADGVSHLLPAMYHPVENTCKLWFV